MNAHRAEAGERDAPGARAGARDADAIAGARVPSLDAAGAAALLRPRIAALVLVTTAAGYLLERPQSFAELGWVLLATLLVSAAGTSLNHYLERDADARMERTRRRPLVTGALTPRQVLRFGGTCLATGLLLAAWGVGVWSTALLALASFTYLAIYTPLKRRTSSNTWVGAVPGALPLVVGAAAASPSGPGALAWTAALLVFLWQLPHFFAIASMYRDEYARGGLRMLSGDDPDDSLLRWQMPMQVMSVILVSALPVLLGQARDLYGLVAMAVGLLFLAAAFGFFRRPDRSGARRVVVASVVYLPLVLLALVIDVACAPVAATARPSHDGHELPVHGVLPDFRLTADDGRPFTRADLLGHVWLVDFIYSRCAGICVDMTKSYAALAAEGLPARLLSITVDPARDDVAALAAYREKQGGPLAAPGAWRLLTGDPEAITALARDGFRLPVTTEAVEVDGVPELFHSGRFALVDRRGRVRGTYEPGDALERQALRADVRRLAAEDEDAASASHHSVSEDNP